MPLIFLPQKYDLSDKDLKKIVLLFQSLEPAEDSTVDLDDVVNMKIFSL